MKKTIAVLICILMILSVMPFAAFAADESDDRELMPIILNQPKDIRLSTDYSGIKDTDIKAAVPAGDDVGYNLFCIDTATGEETMVYEDNYGGLVSGSYSEGEYYFEVFNSNHPEYKVRSEHFTLKKHNPTIFDKIESEFGSLLFLSAFTPLGLVTVVPVVLIKMVISAIENQINQWKIAVIRQG